MDFILMIQLLVNNVVHHAMNALVMTASLVRVVARASILSRTPPSASHGAHLDLAMLIEFVKRFHKLPSASTGQINRLN